MENVSVKAKEGALGGVVDEETGFHFSSVSLLPLTPRLPRPRRMLVPAKEDEALWAAASEWSKGKKMGAAGEKAELDACVAAALAELNLKEVSVKKEEEPKMEKLLVEPQEKLVMAPVAVGGVSGGGGARKKDPLPKFKRVNPFMDEATQRPKLRPLVSAATMENWTRLSKEADARRKESFEATEMRKALEAYVIGELREMNFDGWTRMKLIMEPQREEPKEEVGVAEESEKETSESSDGIIGALEEDEAPPPAPPVTPVPLIVVEEVAQDFDASEEMSVKEEKKEDSAEEKVLDGGKEVSPVEEILEETPGEQIVDVGEEMPVIVVVEAVDNVVDSSEKLSAEEEKKEDPAEEQPTAAELVEEAAEEVEVDIGEEQPVEEENKEESVDGGSLDEEFSLNYWRDIPPVPLIIVEDVPEISESATEEVEVDIGEEQPKEEENKEDNVDGGSLDEGAFSVNYWRDTRSFYL